MTETPQRTYSQTRDLCLRYKVSPRTIYRWIEDGILPQPIHINSRLFFDDAALDERDRERTRGRSNNGAA
jgi:predicted DNA-binding transcriptional regulator AlpA